MKDPIYFPEREIENGSGADCCVNLYTACDMRCEYCDVRFRRHKADMTAEEFAESTKPREGILRAMVYQLARWRRDGEGEHNVLLSPLCDPYPVGCDTSVTRTAIQIIKEHGHRVTILTKNPQERDFDLLDENDTYGVSICCNDELRAYYEPKAPDPLTRVKLMFDAEMKSKCKTMLYIAPLIDARFARDAIRHIRVNRYVIVRPRNGFPVKGAVSDVELAELAGDRMIDYEREWKAEKQ